jgi:DNA-binding response OmpR family regulator
MRLMVVEDEKNMAGLLKAGLEEEKHRVTLAFDGATALELAGIYEFDVIVLDVMLPGLDGIEVARRLRSKHNQTPILMLTARVACGDIVKGLDNGADDYLTKPFSFEELLARIRALGRREPHTCPIKLRVADLTLDPASQHVVRAGQEIQLTLTEYRLLEFLMRSAGRVKSRTNIVDAVWGFDEDVDDNTLDAFVSLLRRKVDRGFGGDLIHTVRGIGYSLYKQQT